MRIKYIILMFAALLAFSSCGEKKKKSYDEIAMSGLTTRTENLKTNIKAYANKGTLIGQMYGTLTGIGWNRWQRCHHPATGHPAGDDSPAARQSTQTYPHRPSFRQRKLASDRRSEEHTSELQSLV